MRQAASPESGRTGKQGGQTVHRRAGPQRSRAELGQGGRARVLVQTPPTHTSYRLLVDFIGQMLLHLKWQSGHCQRLSDHLYFLNDIFPYFPWGAICGAPQDVLLRAETPPVPLLLSDILRQP